jgi:GSH-dependent disulfide-bond oxidoreductase
MIELHTTPTANGYRASIMLEECGLEYRVRAYDLTKGDHLSAEHLALNPVGRVPTIVDHGAPGGRPAIVYGSQAIVQYLAEKTGRFLPDDPVARAAAYTWAGVATSDLGPAYSGQFVFGTLMQDKVPAAIQHFERLCLRILGALDVRLRDHHWLAGEQYTIADMLAYPAAAVSAQRFPGNLDAFANLARWAAEVGARPAVQRGMRVPS